MLMVNILTTSRRARRLAGLAPVHRRRRAAADALEDGGLGGEVLAVMTQRADGVGGRHVAPTRSDRKSTRLNSSHTVISYAVFCLKKKNQTQNTSETNP